jgi:hypothetical protein
MRDKTRGRNTSYRMRAFAKHLASLYMTRCSDVWRNYHFREQAWKMKLAESPISDKTKYFEVRSLKFGIYRRTEFSGYATLKWDCLNFQNETESRLFNQPPTKRP